MSSYFEAVKERYFHLLCSSSPNPRSGSSSQAKLKRILSSRLYENDKIFILLWFLDSFSWLNSLLIANVLRQPVPPYAIRHLDSI